MDKSANSERTEPGGSSPESDVSTLSISVGRCLQLEGSGSSRLRFVLIGIEGIWCELIVASSGPGPVVVIGIYGYM